MHDALVPVEQRAQRFPVASGGKPLLEVVEAFKNPFGRNGTDVGEQVPVHLRIDVGDRGTPTVRQFIRRIVQLSMMKSQHEVEERHRRGEHSLHPDDPIEAIRKIIVDRARCLAKLHNVAAVDGGIEIAPLDQQLPKRPLATGLRVLEFGDLAEREIEEIAFFDTFPEDDSVKLSGAWSVYPFLPSGTIIVSDIQNGLFVLKMQ